ncbi:MAG: hypothetical protein LBJ08_05030 [Bifidobacteriaceae bacterium]|nr:hypothetical protein [Bifidobacteriaceae bacterium]
MRTTLTISDAILQDAKKRARQRGQTLGAFVEDAVCRELAKSPSEAGAVHLPTVPGTGLAPGIDPSSSRQLWDLLDEEASPPCSS